MESEIKIPDGYKEIKIGKIQKGDCYFQFMRWNECSDVSWGSPVICLTKVIRPIIPNGYVLITTGMTSEGDMFLLDGEWLPCFGGNDLPCKHPVARKQEPIIPEGWELVTDGIIQKGDKYGSKEYGYWHEVLALVESPIGLIGHDIIRKKEPKVPEGWHRITEGQIKAGDKLWSDGTWESFHVFGAPVKHYHYVIRRLPAKVPKGWKLIMNGLIKEGDKYDYNGEWETYRWVVGMDVKTSGDRIIRRKDTVPEGWVKVTEGKVLLKDQVWTERGWELAFGCIDHNVKKVDTIRKIQEPGDAQIEIPEGWELIKDGIINPGDYFLDNGPKWKPLNLTDCRSLSVDMYIAIIRRKA